MALLGGGTGMIGDPSGRSDERNLLDRETLAANVAGIRAPAGAVPRLQSRRGRSRRASSSTTSTGSAEIGLIDWLRDVGKHFTIPYMLAKDSVTTRMDRGLSFTEFSYMLIQATDYEHLHRTMGVDLQMGGADQWGNITAGLELIRRRAGLADDEADRGADEPAHGLAYKLLLSPSGAKFGKTEGGTSVWLDAERTSPYAFYQYWLNTDDRDAGTYLRWFTLLGREEIEALEAEMAARAGSTGGTARARPRTSPSGPTARRRGRTPSDRAMSEVLFGRAAAVDPALYRGAPRGGPAVAMSRTPIAARRRRPAIALADAGLFAIDGRGPAR